LVVGRCRQHTEIFSNFFFCTISLIYSHIYIYIYIYRIEDYSWHAVSGPGRNADIDVQFTESKNAAIHRGHIQPPTPDTAAAFLRRSVRRTPRRVDGRLPARRGACVLGQRIQFCPFAVLSNRDLHDLHRGDVRRRTASPALPLHGTLVIVGSGLVLRLTARWRRVSSRRGDEIPIVLRNIYRLRRRTG